MIYFDVVSLFTNVPIDDAYCVALRRLEKDPELPDRTSLSPAKIVSLLEFVLRSTYFLYNGAYYEQTDGAALGSPVSAVIANLYMESFEEEALQSCPPDCRPTLWKRYVDDTFVIAPRDQASRLLNHLNSLKPSIQFTIGIEQNNSILFLDTMVHRAPDGSLTSTENQLVRPKDPIPPGRRGMVYRIPCSDCDKVYIGETDRLIGERIKEHQLDVRLFRVDSSAVAEHNWGAGHHPNWDGVHFVDQDKHWYTRRVKEAIHIRLNGHNINRDRGMDIPGFWLPTNRQHNHRSTGAQRSHTEDTPPHAHGVERATPAEVTRTTSAIHSGGHAEDAVQRYIADSAASRLQLPDEG